MRGHDLVGLVRFGTVLGFGRIVVAVLGIQWEESAPWRWTWRRIGRWEGEAWNLTLSR